MGCYVSLKAIIGKKENTDLIYLELREECNLIKLGLYFIRLVTCYFSVLEWALDEQVSCARLRRNYGGHSNLTKSFMSPL